MELAWHPEVLKIGKKFPDYSQPDGIPGLCDLGISTDGERFIVLYRDHYCHYFPEELGKHKWNEAWGLTGPDVIRRIKLEISAVEKFIVSDRFSNTKASKKYFNEKINYYKAWLKFLETHEHPFLPGVEYVLPVRCCPHHQYENN